MYKIRIKPWKKSRAPRKVLAMRFQALGDTVITLPYLQNLKRQHPETVLHLLTRKEVSAIPKSINLFDKVITFGGKRNAKLQFFLTLLKLPYLWLQNYDVVLDLQKNRISVLLRKLIAPAGWSEFDKYTSHSAGDRTLETINALGLWKAELDTNFTIHTDAEKLLLSNGWKPGYKLVALNPGGSFPSRNWPLEFYVEFAKQWLEQINSHTQFVVLLLPSLRDKADYIANALGEKCIDLTAKANQVEAFAVLQRCAFVLSEDGGLMHMAWVQRVATLALFSSSRKDWSAPQGVWSYCLDSSDMACGPCLREVCKYGDNRCLTRYTPERVIEEAKKLLKVNVE